MTPYEALAEIEWTLEGMCGKLASLAAILDNNGHPAMADTVREWKAAAETRMTMVRAVGPFHPNDKERTKTLLTR